VGLTHYAPWNDPGEPNIYYPTKKRNYVRVAASDDFQGPAMADFFKKLKKKNVYILQDNTTFGKGVAQGFQSRANKLGIKVLAFEAWSEKAIRPSPRRSRIRVLSPSTLAVSSATTVSSC
jgi:ABC-type branched-subunit amino acid transport system substrate-binding protein